MFDLGRFRVARGQLRALLLDPLGQRRNRLLGLPPTLLQVVVLGQREGGTQFTQPGIVLLVVPRLAGRQTHTSQALLQLFNDVLQAQQVVVRALQLPLRLDAADLIAADAGRLLEYLPAFDRAGLQQKVHAALLNDTVGVDPHPRVEQQVADVLAATGVAVEPVLAVAIAVEHAADHDFLVVAAENAGAIVEDELHFRAVGGFTRA